MLRVWWLFLRLASAVAFCALFTGVSACASLQSDGAATAKGAVLGGYDGLQELKKNHPDLDVVKMLNDEDLRKAASDLARATARGAGLGIDDAEIEKKTDRLVKSVFATAKDQSNDAVARLIDEQGPKFKLIVTQTVAASIRDAGSAFQISAKTDGAEAVREIVSAAVGSLATALASEQGRTATETLTRTSGDLGHSALQGAVRGVRDEIATKETTDAFAAFGSRLAEDAAGGVVRGLHQGDDWRTVWVTAATLLAFLFVLVTVALVIFMQRHAMTSRALTVVAQQINHAEQNALSVAALKQTIKERAGNAGVEGRLYSFLKDRGL